MNRVEQALFLALFGIGVSAGAASTANAWQERVALFDSVGPANHTYSCPERGEQDANTITTAKVYVAYYSSNDYVKACAAQMNAIHSEFVDCGPAVSFGSSNKVATIDGTDVATWTNGAAMGKFILYHSSMNNSIGGLWFEGD